MTTLADLMGEGLLRAGEALYWERKQQRVIHKAEVTSQGLLKTQDGAVHRTPSGAAKHLNGHKPVDGWNAWRTEKNRERLSDLRSKLKTSK
jgi:hypothetical protein